MVFIAFVTQKPSYRQSYLHNLSFGGVRLPKRNNNSGKWVYMGVRINIALCEVIIYIVFFHFNQLKILNHGTD